MRSDFCPIYKEAHDSRPRQTQHAHLGLIFDKFADGWIDTGTKFEFDKDIQGQREAGKWLSNFAGQSAGDNALLEEAGQRQRDLVEDLGGRIFALKNVSRFVTGLGNAHPLENGMTWHPTLGVPYLPGSAVKGVLRAWDREHNGEWKENSRFKGELCEKTLTVKERKETEDNFGSQGRVGDLIFFDMLPLKQVALVREIMTPHYGTYYGNKGIPGDWDKPNPIQYLAVKEGMTWQLGVAFQTRSGTLTQLPDDLERMVDEAFIWLGAGAKTTIGFGRFERDKPTEKGWQNKKNEKEAQRQREILEEQEKQTREAARALLSPALAEIQRLADDEKWLQGDQPDPVIFPDKLEAYLAGRATLDPEVKAWLKSCFESRDKKLWTNPEKTKKKKWIELVQKVKSLRDSTS